MQKEDIIDDIEEVDDVVATNETANQVVAKLKEETTPIEKRTYVTYFMTLEERRNAGLVLKYKNVKPESLSNKVVGALSSLFVNNKVHLYLPWWSDEKKHNPIDYYELRFSSNAVGPRRFADPYDPIVIRRERCSDIAAIVYEGCIFRRDSTPMLLELLEAMANDPAEFFEQVGKRWGRCLCCKKEITADKSVERAIGPVCYKRIKRVVKFIRSVRDEIEIKTRNVTIAPTAHALNPIEQDGVMVVTSMYINALKCGFVFDTTFGALLTCNGVVDYGELTEVEVVREAMDIPDPNYRYVGRSRKECLLFQVTVETAHTISMLTQLDAQWNERNKVWVVLKDYKQKLNEYFRIQWKKPIKHRARVQNTTTAANNTATNTTIATNTNTATNASNNANVAPSKIQMNVVGDHVELSGITYPYRTLIRGIGGEWNKDKKIWTVPIAAKDKAEELVRNIK